MATDIATIDITQQAETLCTRHKITQTQAELLTALVVCGGNISRASQIVGHSRQHHYQSLGYSEAYRAAYKEAVTALGNAAWLKLADRAINGDIVLYQGEIVRDPETGEPLRQFSDVAQIYVSKSGAGFSDQPSSGKPSGGNTQINVIMPPNTSAPTIEVNHADADPATNDADS